MAELKMNAISLLSSTSINMKTTSKQTLYTVPTGKVLIVDHIHVRKPSATLVGAVDTDFGGDATPSDWILEVTLAGLTAVTHQAIIAQPAQAAGPPIVPVQKIIYAAAIAFGLIVNTVSTGAATVQMDLYGYLYDA